MSQRVMDDGVTLGFAEAKFAVETHFTLIFIVGEYFGWVLLQHIRCCGFPLLHPLSSRARDKESALTPSVADDDGSIPLFSGFLKQKTAENFFMEDVPVINQGNAGVKRAIDY